ncbi:GNAT family N-acetyltransferase [Lacticaseibacillus nasuensis]|uniref:GNAT family N-acetyltransferase n=1 Tax=Lacticaseibacillus nasuensis TaxID=944671 RepID=UPI002246349A|nr:N-acetyltransferase [Lacticaseibacillus nasuensis]MCX2455106.1 N-acetyltransferase [Lacticaseibacillus nasuensis]
MAQFEQYHPILSAHYRLDWLTTFKLKDVFALRHDAQAAAQSDRPVATSFEEAARTLNRAMLDVMNNNALLYGIGSRQTGALLGSFAIAHFAADRTTATVQFETLPTTDREVMVEVLPRMVGFAFFELGLTQVTAQLPDTATGAIGLYQQWEFTATPALDREGWLNLSLARERVAEDPRFRQ